MIYGDGTVREVGESGAYSDNATENVYNNFGHEQIQLKKAKEKYQINCYILKSSDCQGFGEFERGSYKCFVRIFTRSLPRY